MILYRFYHLKILTCSKLDSFTPLKKCYTNGTMLLLSNMIQMEDFKEFVDIRYVQVQILLNKLKKLYKSKTHDRTAMGSLWHIHTLVQHYSAPVLSTPVSIPSHS